MHLESTIVEPSDIKVSIFADFLKVEELGNKGSGLILYGLNQAPQLDVLTKWSEVHYLAVPNDSYKVSSLLVLSRNGYWNGDWYFLFCYILQYWIQYLNKGSRVKVSYNVESVGSSLYLVIAQGMLEKNPFLIIISLVI